MQYHKNYVQNIYLDTLEESIAKFKIKTERSDTLVLGARWTSASYVRTRGGNWRKLGHEKQFKKESEALFWAKERVLSYIATTTNRKSK